MYAIRSYYASIDSRMTCYGELETYLIDNGCRIGNIHLARRRQHLIKAEKEWALRFIDEYNASHVITSYSIHYTKLYDGPG